MTVFSHFAKSAAVAFIAATALGLAANEADARVKVGVLECRVAPGVGMIVGSSKALSCNFTPTGRKAERYTGRITKIGLDVGFTKGGVIVWGVFAPTAGYTRHALAGHYGGASAQATLVAGLGANVLVGGGGKSFALQPFSVSGQTGVSLAIGIAGLDLYAAR
jgi:hypothetical protein